MAIQAHFIGGPRDGLVIQLERPFAFYAFAGLDELPLIRSVEEPGEQPPGELSYRDHHYKRVERRADGLAYRYRYIEPDPEDEAA